jgi:murein DD-endopeptidase MepM/ murein hydrolase activator NlpD
MRSTATWLPRIAATPSWTLFISKPYRKRIHQNEGSISGHQIILAVRSDTPVLSPMN